MHKQRSTAANSWQRRQFERCQHQAINLDVITIHKRGSSFWSTDNYLINPVLIAWSRGNVCCVVRDRYRFFSRERSLIVAFCVCVIHSKYSISRYGCPSMRPMHVEINVRPWHVVMRDVELKITHIMSNKTVLPKVSTSVHNPCGRASSCGFWLDIPDDVAPTIRRALNIDFDTCPACLCNYQTSRSLNNAAGVCMRKNM